MTRRLPLPVRQILDEPIDERAIARMTSTRRPARRRRTAALGGAALAMAVVLAGWLAWPTEGPLRMADGAAIAPMLRAGPSGSALQLDDGSRVELAGASTLVTLENDAREVAFLLEEGRATFDVRPRGPRRWTVECGLATVVVVGTRFTIEREPERLLVMVERGAVLVRGERVPDRVRRLDAGERFELVTPQATEVAEESPSAAPPTERASGSDAPVAATALPDEPHRPAARAPQTSWRALAEEHRWDDAFDALGERGMARVTAGGGVDELLAVADVARLSGHPADAVAPLTRILDEHPGDSNASLAAFSLGRIEHQLGRPARAAAAFERALTLGLPDALRGDALARLAAALLEAGDSGGAASAARRYLREHPSGPRARDMRTIGEAR